MYSACIQVCDVYVVYVHAYSVGLICIHACDMCRYVYCAVCGVCVLYVVWCVYMCLVHVVCVNV